jgi:hypothetical protein
MQGARSVAIETCQADRRGSAHRATPQAGRTAILETASKVLLLLATGLLTAPAYADQVSICYNYDCAIQANVIITGRPLLKIRALLRKARNAEEERVAIAQAIGQFETIAAQQTPTGNDKGGNSEDDGVEGRMDCLDHSHNTTAYLKLLEQRGWLKYHRVLERVMRAPYIVNDHWAARIVEIRTGQEYIVDSWFFDNGHPAAIFTLEDWKAGASPDEP